MAFLKVLMLKKNKCSKERIICHYRYLLDEGLKFQSSVCNCCHNVLRMELNSIAILNIHDVDYRCIINGISKSEAINLLLNVDLSEKNGSL